jgi:hypothetical protein
MVFHPLVFAAVPILFLYAHNRERFTVGAEELVLPLLLALAATAVLWLVLGLLLGSAARAGVLCSLAVLLFLSYGHIAGIMRPPVPRWLPPAGSGLLLLAGLVWTVRPRRGFGSITRVLNLVALALLAVNTAFVLPEWLSRSRNARGHPAGRTAGAGPDIYYIILDTYVRADVMRESYDTDISGFTDFLKSRGFQVAQQSRSNYSQTYLSLAASLNFTYLDSLARVLGPEAKDQSPLMAMIEHSRLTDFLRRRGYALVTFASGYTGTELKDADRRLAPPWALSEFQDLLLGTTMLPWLLGPRLGALEDESHRERVRYTLRTIPDAARGPRPVFVFAHVVSPHTPFVFDARGRRPDIIPYLRINQTGTLRQVTRTQLAAWYRENYGPQVQYLNRLLEQMTDRILAHPERPAVIILQADHGAGEILQRVEGSPDQFRRRMAILNAIRVPPAAVRDARPVLIPDSLTPVNTFRILLPALFDTAMAVLPDRSYFSPLTRPFQFTDADSVAAGTR